MRHRRTTRVALIVAGLLIVPQAASAQSASSTPPHFPLQKTIGQSQPQVVPSLFVLNSRGVTLQGGKLALAGVSPNAIVFARRQPTTGHPAVITPTRPATDA
jgi:hypothetical protein